MEEWYWRNGGHARSSAIMGEIVEKTYVCNSVTRDVMIQQFHRNPESVETVHIGIDEVQFDASKVRSGILYEELGISEKRPIVPYLSVAFIHKNVHFNVKNSETGANRKLKMLHL
ncbi:MAG: hypothetical protein ACLTR6_14260 [Clostridium fessum]